MATVANTHRLGVGGQSQLIAGTCVAEDVATVSAVVLEDRKEAEDMPHSRGLHTSRFSTLPPEAYPNLEGVLNLSFHIYVPVKSRVRTAGLQLLHLTTQVIP